MWLLLPSLPSSLASHLVHSLALSAEGTCHGFWTPCHRGPSLAMWLSTQWCWQGVQGHEVSWGGPQVSPS